MPFVTKSSVFYNFIIESGATLTLDQFECMIVESDILSGNYDYWDHVTGIDSGESIFISWQVFRLMCLLKPDSIPNMSIARTELLSSFKARKSSLVDVYEFSNYIGLIDLPKFYPDRIPETAPILTEGSDSLLADFKIAYILRKY
jgi:hypothetical protein